MENCVLYCSGCVKEIPIGYGAALSCQCFFCPSCLPLVDNLGRRRVPQQCPTCQTSQPDIVSLHPKEVPDEIRHLIGNPNKHLEEIVEQVSFHCSHYRGVIEIAQAKIKELQSALAAKSQQEFSRQYTATPRSSIFLTPILYCVCVLKSNNHNSTRLLGQRKLLRRI